MAVYNRRDTTLAALHALKQQRMLSDDLHIFVYDDGSTDGTSEAIRSRHSDVMLVSGSDAFWARGMSIAERAAFTSGVDLNYLLWLNDDVVLHDDAIIKLLRVAQREADGAIIVGAVSDSSKSRVTYSAMRRRGIHPLSFDLLQPGSSVQTADAFNGNVVLVPLETALALGGVDGGFGHALADIDYGLRANQAQIPVVLAPGVYGVCDRNVDDASGSLLQRWSLYLSLKGGGHPPSNRRFLARHGGRFWTVFYVASYVLWWVRELMTVLRPRQEKTP